MTRKALRIAVAFATFTTGLTVVWLSGLLASAETRLADWLVPTQEVALPAPSFVSTEEAETKEVYKTLIRDLFTYPNTRLAVVTSKVGGYPGIEADEVALETEYVQRRMPGVRADTLSDYISKSGREESLTDLHGLGMELALVDPYELEKLFSTNGVSGWWLFYHKYPGSSGIISFSRVGFSREHDQAFVYASRGCGGLCGEGWKVLLRKTERGWVIQEKLMVWVS